MESLLNPLLASILKLPEILAYLFVFVLAFAIIEVSQFQGTNYYRCRTTPAPVGGVWEIDKSVTRFCSAYGYGSYDCPEGSYCGHPDMYDLDLDTENVDNMIETYYDVVNFNIITKALLANVQLLTHERWGEMMFRITDTMNAVFGRIYFPIIIYVGCFYILNLIVAVIVDSLLKNKETEAEVAANEMGEQLALENIQRREENSIAISNGMQSPVVNPLFDTPKPLLSNKHEPRSEDSRNTERESEEEKKEGSVEVGVSRKGAKAIRILNILVIIVILANIIIMCFDRLGISDEEVELLDIIDAAFFGFFVLEMLIKMGIHGFTRYFYASPVNVLDVVVNVFGLAEVILAQTEYSMYYGVRGTIITFRTFRVFKLVDKWQTLQETLTFISMTLGEILNFMILLALFVFVYAIIGMELFAERVKFNSDDRFDLINGESVEFNFDSLKHALITCYTMVISDNWSTFLYLYSRRNDIVGVIYYFTGIYVLNVFLVNVFLAIILQNFYVDETKKEWEEQELKDKIYAEKLKKIKKQETGYKEREKTLLTALKIFKSIIALNRVCKERNKMLQSLIVGRALFILDETNKFRITVHGLVNSMPFKWISYICSVAITVVLTFQTPLYDPDGNVAFAMKIVSICLLVFFIIEIILNLIAFGFLFNGKDSYLRNPLNLIDAVSTTALLVQLATGNPSHSVFGRLVMVLVALRVVRITLIKEGFNLCIQAIIRGLPSILMTLAVAALFLFVLAAVGITFFKGMMHFCDKENLGPTVSTDEFSTYFCMDSGGEWKANDVSFDNIFTAFFILFELITGNSWCLVVMELAETYGFGIEEEYEVRYSTTFFLIICSIIGFLYIRAIINGLISHAFNTEKEEIEGITNLKYSQRKWVQFSKVIFKASPIKKVYC